MMLELALAAWLQAGAARPAADGEAGSTVCAECHAKIYQSYMQSGMARSSGRVGTDGFGDSFSAGEFQDEALGARYKVTGGTAAYKLEFARETTGVRGERMLRWFVGSGSVGRSYLFAQDGFVFQAPVSYFSSVKKWGLSPGYAGKPLMDLARPVEIACLQCHASRLQPVAGTQNRYRETPFLEGGVSCERCHGEGRRHVAARSAGLPFKPGEIVNPAKLDSAQRDSVCQQCHLTGAARVALAGKSVGSFRPGDYLSDHLAVVVWGAVGNSERAVETAATDHAEQLYRSECKKAAGEKLMCTTCHDPHSQPESNARVEFYRARCMSCHSPAACNAPKEKRSWNGDDCAACHMPKGRSREGEHVAYTNHRIRKRWTDVQIVDAKNVLISFFGDPLGDRELALAWAGEGMERPAARPVALRLLQRVEVAAAGGDVAILSQLAQYYDAMGQGEQARALYERVLKLDPGNVAAGANVGVYWAQSGRIAEAIVLWEKIVANNPAMTSVAINLAVAQHRVGRKEAAVATLERLLRFQPDLTAARQLLSQMRGR